MFVHVILVHMMKMAVVKIIHMAVMANRGVPAFQAMLMSVIGMMLLGAGCHDCVLSSFRNLSGPLVPVSLQPPGNWQLRKGRSCSRNRNESSCTRLNPVSVAGHLRDRAVRAHPGIARPRSEDGPFRTCQPARRMSVLRGQSGKHTLVLSSSQFGTFQTWRDVRVESGARSKADIIAMPAS